MPDKTQKNSRNKKKVVATIGRFMPIHNGHKSFLVKLAREYDKIVVMIGSAYEGESIRYCITATEREKMLAAIFKAEGIPESKVVILPMEDKPTFEEWLDDVLEICNKYNVTHFCTGNQEDILDVLDKKGIKLNMDFINPEADSTFPYHATDIRNMIINGEYNKLESLIPNETKPILFRYTFKEILAASENRGISFVKGRQTVDLILMVRDINDGNIYVLLGRRPYNKKDFPGAFALPGGSIRKYETAINAAIRNFFVETGIKISMIDNSLEPAIVKISNVPNTNLEQLHMVGIYGSRDESLNGSRGGSSQCFALLVEDDINKFKDAISPTAGLKNVKFYCLNTIDRQYIKINGSEYVKLAFQHADMLQKAIWMLNANPKLDGREVSNNT